jgi:hypothetical protein
MQVIHHGAHGLGAGLEIITTRVDLGTQYRHARISCSGRRG